MDELFVTNPLDVKVNNEYAFDIAVHFPVGELLLCLRAKK
jgi:hypothetical protein